ncbi:hypothetical protein ROZALSC1DRAFT_26940 [Rozella allomycis CSF55]|uniref:Phosphoribulokinase/uridine kinase domain-containing protein n=1 Tax=Rozella allomycis (strain CSF55) TaxID=988480 RepID=A0A075B025_ROZAC|nr:hypothetical protein O9G_005957 [Rozella allomycis CSF55]RKP21654.1 hypothetical protein ROZALSC1DRAFT_26940 [Rozella allomycis CSF55]|eukprot:EPZ35878.1 hypothetical protein O9G_005957 [Rozella allomycis CSF55]
MQLAERLNLSSVIKTDSEIYEPLWTRKNIDTLKSFREDCELVAKGLKQELIKCVKDGKTLILEGIHFNELVVETIRKIITEGGGIFIPYFVTLSDTYSHDNMINEWLERYKIQNSVDQVKSRILLVQSNLRRQHQNQIILDDFPKTLDCIHESFLRSLEMYTFPEISE